MSDLATPLTRFSRSGRWALGALALAALSACSLTPEYQRPEAPVPATFSGAPAAQAAVAATPALPAWSDFVADERLREVVRLALANNRDLRVAMANVEQVRAQHQIARANVAPTLNVGVTGERVATEGGNISSTYTSGLLVSAWEIDFFGRLGSLREAALANFLASEEALHAAQTSLVAAVTSTWLTLQADEELLALTRDTQVTRDESLRLTRLRFENGASSALDLRQAESLAATARATLAQQQRQREQDRNALALLVGQAVPAEWLPQVPSAQTVALPDVPEGLPSDLLERRPDIRQAEQQLRAANANIGAARAAFFPRISLTSSLGSASTELSGLFKDGSWGFTLAPQALLPIFDLGRNQASLGAARAARDGAVAQYEKSIQAAFREVADALAGRATLGEQLKAQEDLVRAESDRMRLAELRYRNGVASYLDVLDAQRSLFTARQAQVQTALAQRLNQVTLYKALGGGY